MVIVRTGSASGLRGVTSRHHLIMAPSDPHRIEALCAPLAKRPTRRGSSERAAAVDADPARDVNSGFDGAADRENAAWDALTADDESRIGGHDAQGGATVTPPEPDDFNGA
jgi:hypothetical protein